jgi:hypothetical protein
MIHANVSLGKGVTPYTCTLSEIQREKFTLAERHLHMTLFKALFRAKCPHSL